jgi:hypothetical protein
MAFAIYPALFFTVALLVTTAYFLMGGLPLLVLDHDTALDARFVRGFFNACYRAAMVTAGGAALSYALWGRFAFAVGALALVALAVLLRRQLLAAMARLGERIQAADAAAIRAFQRVHGMALAANAVQLVLVVWGITRLSL